MVYEALTNLKDPSGCDIGTIVNFIEVYIEIWHYPSPFLYFANCSPLSMGIKPFMWFPSRWWDEYLLWIWSMQALRYVFFNEKVIDLLLFVFRVRMKERKGVCFWNYNISIKIVAIIMNLFGIPSFFFKILNSLILILELTLHLFSHHYYCCYFYLLNTAKTWSATKFQTATEF